MVAEPKIKYSVRKAEDEQQPVGWKSSRLQYKLAVLVAFSCFYNVSD